MIQKRFTVIKKDLVQYGYLALQAKYTLTLLFGVSVFMVAVLVDSVGENSFASSDIIFLLPVVLFFVFLFMPYILAKKTITQNTFFKDEFEISVDEEEFRISTTKTHSAMPLKDAHGYREDKRVIALYIMQNQAFLIPKRIFTNEELKEISELLRKNVKRKGSKFFQVFTIVFAVLFVCAAIGLYF